MREKMNRVADSILKKSDYMENLRREIEEAKKTWPELYSGENAVVRLIVNQMLEDEDVIASGDNFSSYLFRLNDNEILDFYREHGLI